MAGMPKLENAVIGLQALRAHTRSELLGALDSVTAPEGGKGSKALVLDPTLSGPLGMVAEVREIKEHGVEKIYHLAPGPLVTACASVVYFVRPELALIELVVGQLKQLGLGRDCTCARAA